MDRLSDFIRIPLDDWVELLVKDWLVPNFRPVFQAIEWPIDQVLVSFETFLLSIPPLLFTPLAALIAWQVAGRGVGLLTLCCAALIDMLGVWNDAMTTLAMVMTSVLFCAAVGVPLGILAGRSDRFAAGIRPVLDIMQTIPAFVYLVPIVMLFGVGIVPGIIATIIFSLPPIVRLTNLGLRQVPEELVEAGYAFGSKPRQVLWEIQLPLALPSIMAGLNQTLMLSLSMVVIAALIGAEGLGLVVFTGIGRLDVGAAALGGIGIVLIAIVLDRVTQAIGRSGKESGAAAQASGPLATLKRRFGALSGAPIDSDAATKKTTLQK